MSKSNLSLNIGGTAYEGWTGVSVTLSMENLSGSFQLTLTDPSGSGAATIRPNDPCTVLINGQVVITGYVDKVTPSFDAESHQLVVTGRDKAGDLVDSSVVNGTGQYKNQKIDAIVKKVAEPFGIEVENKVGSTKKLETFNVDQGATGLETIQKLAKRGGFLVVSNGKGGIQITRAGTETMGTALVQGQNILAANCDYDASKKHSEYHVKGQKQGRDNDSVKKIAHNKAIVENEFTNRYRPLLIIDDGQSDETSVKDRAKWEAAIRQAKATKAEITVVGWQENPGSGSIWGINRLVKVESSLLGMNDTMLISSVNFTLDENGELAKITVTPPSAYSSMSGDKISKPKGKAGEKSEKNNPYSWSGG
jgi:prophage tail gpP-like protein